MSKLPWTAGTLGFERFNPALGPGAGLLQGAIAQPSSEQILEGVQQESQAMNDAAAQFIADMQPIETQTVPVEEIIVDDQSVESEASEQEYGELDRLLGDFQGEQPPEDSSESEQEEYRSWRDRMVNYLRARRYSAADILKTLTVIGKLIGGGWLMWNYLRENKMYNPDNKRERETMNNQQFDEWIEQRPVPSHCFRKKYIDSQGVLHSVTICDAFGQRVYHDY